VSAVPDRLLAAATTLFAARGYEGTSVRAICAAAETNLNAVTYHFGGKKALYAAVIRGAGDRRLASAQRILAHPAGDAAELRTLLILFAEEVIAAWSQEPGVLTILFAEMQQGFRNAGPEVVAGLRRQTEVLGDFLQAAREAGLLREGVDLAMVVGALMERLHNQVMFADVLQAQFGGSIADPAYRRHWVEQTVDLLLHGAAR
jgi:AcrR family transcriptional regulator